jgi:hypothetical protein
MKHEGLIHDGKHAWAGTSQGCGWYTQSRPPWVVLRPHLAVGVKYVVAVVWRGTRSYAKKIMIAFLTILIGFLNKTRMIASLESNP